ncbi:MAG: hypothetical protein ACLSFO_02545 [Anaerovoracaceae bacterium]
MRNCGVINPETSTNTYRSEAINIEKVPGTMKPEEARKIKI